ncbi:(deoxy)nucleoside triphosphate pyrophosphohydrolase [Gillisia hiemivivida]|uniref:8-oxo-dGTP diphosphatase n=1 Tax=Gillisia hiemivivida TaxID=291190 RepID=A0A5C6ZPR5_9FLAO|nr:(deoxy)nucleoside triphosphate pyrophosphohydrolase [Gillisia hiemivivida]TXD92751.1 (deoxy)nucleoside triphosphate pyrophosphohydrolase [Gillisia hiemivivida]
MNLLSKLNILKVSCAIIEMEGKILCAQRSEIMKLPLKWEFPGGKKEKNESYKECLKREIKEELDLEIEIVERLPSFTYRFLNKERIKLIPFRCKALSRDINLTEHQEIKWLGKEQLKKLDWAEADIPIVNYYIQNYK